MWLCSLIVFVFVAVCVEDVVAGVVFVFVCRVDDSVCVCLCVCP